MINFYSSKFSILDSQNNYKQHSKLNTNESLNKSISLIYGDYNTISPELFFGSERINTRKNMPNKPTILPKFKESLVTFAIIFKEVESSNNPSVILDKHLSDPKTREQMDYLLTKLEKIYFIENTVKGNSKENLIKRMIIFNKTMGQTLSDPEKMQNFVYKAKKECLCSDTQFAGYYLKDTTYRGQYLNNQPSFGMDNTTKNLIRGLSWGVRIACWTTGVDIPLPEIIEPILAANEVVSAVKTVKDVADVAQPITSTVSTVKEVASPISNSVPSSVVDTHTDFSGSSISNVPKSDPSYLHPITEHSIDHHYEYGYADKAVNGVDACLGCLDLPDLPISQNIVDNIDHFIDNKLSPDYSGHGYLHKVGENMSDSIKMSIGTNTLKLTSSNMRACLLGRKNTYSVKDFTKDLFKSILMSPIYGLSDVAAENYLDNHMIIFETDPDEQKRYFQVYKDFFPAEYQQQVTGMFKYLQSPIVQDERNQQKIHMALDGIVNYGIGKFKFDKKLENYVNNKKNQS